MFVACEETRQSPRQASSLHRFELIVVLILPLDHQIVEISELLAQKQPLVLHVHQLVETLSGRGGSHSDTGACDPWCQFTGFALQNVPITVMKQSFDREVVCLLQLSQPFVLFGVQPDDLLIELCKSVSTAMKHLMRIVAS